MMFVKVVPSILDCHCTLGVGLPDAVEMNEAVLFRHIVALFGCAVTKGAVLIVIVALPDTVPVQLTSVIFVTV